MKQYTTPSITVTITGMQMLLAAAQRVVVAIQGDELVKLETERLEINGCDISFTLTEQETGKLFGRSALEVTLFVDDLVYKTETQTLVIDKAVWTNAD